MRKFIRALVVVVIAGASLGTATVLQARHEYYGVCSQLDGFPGLLQRAGFFQSGTCVGKPGGALCNAGAGCTVNGNSGICTNTGKPGGAAVCTCQVGVTPP
jgi:hypothetical protein